MKKSDGSLCTTPEENAEVFRSHFEGLYTTSPEYDEVHQAEADTSETGTVR